MEGNDDSDRPFSIGKRDPSGTLTHESGTQIDLYQPNDIQDPETLLSLKPKNTDDQWDNNTWLLFCQTRGVVVAWSKCFMMWADKQHEEISEIENSISSRPDVSGNIPRAMTELYYGNAGVEAWQAVGNDFEKIKEYLCDPRRTWRTGDLGLYGRWFQKAEINPIYISFALRAYMED